MVRASLNPTDSLYFLLGFTVANATAKLMSLHYFMLLPLSLLQETPHYVTGRMASVYTLWIAAQQILLTARYRITAHVIQTNVAAGKNLAKN